MGVVIKIDKNYIPVKIGELEFKFKIDDKSVQDLQQTAKELGELDEENNTNLDIFKQAFDVLFGDNAGEKIYKECGESTIVMVQVFFDTLRELLFESMAKQGADMNELDEKTKSQMFGKFLSEFMKLNEDESQGKTENEEQVGNVDLSQPLNNQITIAYVNDDEERIELTFTDINFAFDNVLRFSKLMEDESVSDNVKLYDGLSLLIGSQTVDELLTEIPQEFGNVYKELMYTIFDNLEENQLVDLNGDPMPTPKIEKSFDIEQDAEFIYASFLFDYGIDLFEQQGKLDYRKFIALLRSLSSDTKLQKVIEIREMDIPTGKGVKSKDKDAIRKAKEFYRLREEGG